MFMRTHLKPTQAARKATSTATTFSAQHNLETDSKYHISKDWNGVIIDDWWSIASAFVTIVITMFKVQNLLKIAITVFKVQSLL